MSAVTPLPAGQLRNHAGVIAHTTYWDTPYGDWGKVVAALQDIGIKQVRCGTRLDPNQGSQARHEAELAALRAAGIRALLGFGRDAYRLGILDQPLKTAAKFKDIVLGFEGPNEMDINYGAGWEAQLRAWQTYLYTEVKSDPALSTVPVVGPSFGGWYTTRDELVAQGGDLTASLDAGNIHPYTAGSTETPAHVAREKLASAKVSGNKPIWATESGEVDDLTFANSSPADVNATYRLRTVLEHKKAGLARSFTYELLDHVKTGGRADQHMGLLTADYQYKPAAKALKNLLGLLGPDGPAPAGGLDVSLSDPGVRWSLFRRVDGVFLLALWRTAEIWDRAKKQRIKVEPGYVAVALPAAKKVESVLPVTGPTVHPTGFSKGRLQVCLAGEPLILLVQT